MSVVAASCEPSLVLVDEAAQATEVATYGALRAILRGGVGVLIGDQKHLRPYVDSQSARAKGLAISRFERLIQFVGIPHHMLSIQYRSHETICAVYNKLVYLDLLQGHPALQ